MKRDLELIRNILLAIENVEPDDRHAININSFLHLNNNPYVISHHIKLLLDSNFIEAEGPIYTFDIDDYYIDRITSSGYDYLDSVRSPEIWAATKKKLLTVGGSATLDIVKSVATDFVKDFLTGRLPIQ